MKNNKRLGNFLKYLTYIIIVFVVYLVQTNPVFLSIMGYKPNILYSCAVVIAMIEGEFIGGLMGMLCGMLCDLGSYNTFGFNTILLLVLSAAVGLLVIYYMRNTKRNALMLATAVLTIRGLLEYFFVYIIWDYSGVEYVFFDQIFPVIVYSLLFTAPMHILFQYLHRYFLEKYHI